MRRLPVVLTILAASLLLSAPALADDRRISATSGPGKQAADAAKQRVGGGKVLRVRVDDDDDPRERYRVDIRRRAASGRVFKYEVDVSASFRVTDVERERFGSDDGHDDHDDD